MSSLKTNKIRKKIQNMYSSVIDINNRLDQLIQIDLKRDFTEKEEIEFVELKRYRSKLDDSYPFFN